MFWRRKPRCKSLSPSVSPRYAGRRCQRELGHDGVCWITVGAYKHMWQQGFYERLGKALEVE